MKRQILFTAAAFALLAAPAFAQDRDAPAADTSAEAAVEAPDDTDTTMDTAATASSEASEQSNAEARSVKSEKDHGDCDKKREDIAT